MRKKLKFFLFCIIVFFILLLTIYFFMSNGLFLRLSPTSATLTWNDNSANEDGFKIERDSGSGFVQIATIGPNSGAAATYIDNTIQTGVPYSYRVRAYNGVGDSGYSNTALITTPQCSFTPNPQTQSCNTGLFGVCAVGMQTCNALEQWGSCLQNIQPSSEICDNKDNDCNGLVDDNIASASCSNALGCPGTTSCVSGQSVCNAATCVCSPGSPQSCFVGAGTPGVGICHSGTKTCNAQGTGYGSCVGQVTAIPEICNGLDDDCDGQTDENINNNGPLSQVCYTGSAGTQGVGTCVSGFRSCNNGQWPSSCAGEVLPQLEICGNGQDEDCDGVPDNGCVPNDPTGLNVVAG